MTAAEDTRKLATILAIDVVGYSAAAERDQAGAAGRIAALRACVLALADKYAGRLFHTAGDAFMLEFRLASAGVRAAIALLEDAVKTNSALPPVRIGAHLGEVMIDAADVLGHGVNVASRLATHAEPNALVISDALKTQLHGEVDVAFLPLGAVRLSKMRETIVAHTYVAGAGEGLRRRLVRLAKRHRRALIAAGGAAAIAATVAIGFAVRPQGYLLDDMEMVALSRRTETQPTLSPDRRFVVYTVEMAPAFLTNADLFMHATAGGEAEPLTDTPDLVEFSPAFSSDGRMLAYARNVSLHARPAGGSPPCEIIVRVFPHGLDRKVGSCAIDIVIQRLAWTPDGRSLVYAERPAQNEPRRIRSLNIETGAVRDLVPPIESGPGDANVSVSPDGGRLAFARYTEPVAGDVYTYDLGNGRLTRVTDGVQSAQAAWADANNLFVTQSVGEGEVELLLMRADGGGRVQTFPRPARGIRRPDAVPGLLALEVTSFIFNLRRFERGRITTVSNGNQTDADADFSRDGALAFISWQSRNWIYLQAPGEQPRRLIEMTGTAPAGLRWSPDGRRLVYIASKGERTQLFVVDVASGVIRPVEIGAAASPGNPDWSPDGRSLVFTDTSEAGARLMRVAADASSPPQPISGLGWIEGIETAEGLFAVNASELGIWRLAPGRAPELVVPRFWNWHANSSHSARIWTVANGRIYGCVPSETPGARVRVLSWPVTGGAPTTVIDVEGGPTGSLAVDPVTGSVVYGLSIDEQSDIGVIGLRRQ